MSSDEQEQCERGAAAGQRVHADGGAAPARAWAESEEPGSPAESHRLLDPPPPAPVPPPHKPRLQAPLTLAVWPMHKIANYKRTAKHLPIPQPEKPLTKTKYQKRKEKLVAALRPPYFILSMIILIVVLHMCESDQLRSLLEWSPGAGRREPWRLVTYGWVHASAAHVALNCLVALAVGWRLEREQGWWRCGLLWGAGVAAGALGAGALQPTVRVVGASAAVYALLTAHLPNVCLRFGHIPLWWFRPLSVVVLAASEAWWSALRVTPAGVPHEQVAWAAHVSGAAVGVPLSFLVFTGEHAGSRALRCCRAASLAVLAAAGALAALYFLHCSQFHPHS